ncbi:hypothetical protein Scep_021129 [Stephania cephalantha]|uniref:RRM domain-containing protein n=1 Tax=Stephania cephalantha TaxID=152367 RepID=A0AAP0F5J7_9MAGN
MGEETTVFARFPGTHLDPKAQEFRPASPCPNTQIALVTPHIYFPYPHHAHHFIPPFYDPLSTPPPPPPTTPMAYRGGGYAPPRATATATRAVVVSMVPPYAAEEGVRRELEVFGEVRGVEMGRLAEGIVAVQFYDIRGAEAAVAVIQERHMEEQSRLRQQHYCGVVMPPVPVVGPGFVAGRAVWAYFVMPETAPVPVPDGFNQGTIVVFNLDANVSVVMLKEIFEAYGLVKEVRETPLKRQQRFVEFFDVRDAARAVVEMDGKEINGRRVVVDFSRPGGIGEDFQLSILHGTTIVVEVVVMVVITLESQFNNNHQQRHLMFQNLIGGLHLVFLLQVPVLLHSPNTLQRRAVVVP